MCLNHFVYYFLAIEAVYVNYRTLYIHKLKISKNLMFPPQTITTTNTLVLMLLGLYVCGCKYAHVLKYFVTKIK